MSGIDIGWTVDTRVGRWALRAGNRKLLFRASHTRAQSSCHDSNQAGLNISPNIFSTTGVIQTLSMASSLVDQLFCTTRSFI